MNNNGKGGALFVLLIPVFIIVVLLVVDTFISYSQNKTFKEITEIVIKEVEKNEDLDEETYREKIAKTYENFGYKTDDLLVIKEYNGYTIENEHLYFGVFNSFLKAGVEEQVTFFDIEYLTFKIRKSSRAFVKARVIYDNKGEYTIEFED